MASENDSNKNEVDVFDGVIDIPVILFQDSADSTRPTVEVTSSNNNGHVMIEKGPGQVPTQASGTLAISIPICLSIHMPSHPVPAIEYVTRV